MTRLKKRNNDRALSLTRIGRHYRVRDEAVGISPRLIDVDKSNALFILMAYDTDSKNAAKNKLCATYLGWELTNVGNEDSVISTVLRKRWSLRLKGLIRRV